MKTIKKLTALLLSVALLITLAPQTSANAATKTQKETLLAGEVVTYSSFFGTIKTVSTNKKAVATVKKKDGKAVVTAKKAGSATITIKTTRGTNKIKLTIKKADFVCSVKDLSDGYALISVKNNTSVFADNVTVSYTLKNPEGEVISKDSCTVNDVMPKKTAYTRVYYDSGSTISAANSTASVSSTYRSLSATYKSRVSTTKAAVTSEDPDNYKMTLKIQNGYSGKIYGTVDIFFYDTDGNIISYSYRSVYISGKGVDTQSISTPYGGYASYKLAVRTYSKVYS